jgi:DNA repair protein RadC
MTGTRVYAVAAYAEHLESATRSTRPRGHRVRELVCAYRPARDSEGRTISVPSLALDNPHAAAQIVAPLLADQLVETFAVACVSARNRLLAWHLVSRGTRASTPISIPDVFVPACVTPGTVSLLVVHNHPSGDPSPSADDVALTARLESAAAVLDFSLLDHLIVGEEQRYFSFRAAGLIGTTPAGR